MAVALRNVAAVDDDIQAHITGVCNGIVVDRVRPAVWPESVEARAYRPHDRETDGHFSLDTVVQIEWEFSQLLAWSNTAYDTLT